MLAERIAEESRCSAKPADSRILRTACEPGQSGSVMVTLVRSLSAKTSSVSASRQRKESVQDDVRRQDPIAGANRLRRARQTRVAQAQTASLQVPLHLFFQTRQIRRKSRRRRLFEQVRQRPAEARESGHRGETLRPQPVQCLLDQQIQQRRGSRRLGGPILPANVASVQISRGRTGYPDRASEWRMCSTMVAVGTIRSEPGCDRKCSSAARDFPDAGGPEIRRFKFPLYGRRRASGYFLPSPPNCGASSVRIFWNFSRWAGCRIWRIRLKPVERRSSS